MNVSGAKFDEIRRKKAHAKRRVCAKCVYGGKLSKWQKRHMEFWLGGVGYGLLELLWRGETHWSMVLTGGVCLLAICAVNRKLEKKNIVLRAAVCAAAITLVEFAVGMLVNRWLGLAVWNYSGMFGNVLGQVCPLYTFLWFLLSLPVCAVAKRVNRIDKR